MALICTIGDLVTDVVVALDTDPQRGSDTKASIHSVRGGSAANVAVAAIAAGGSARFIGQVGDDAAGELLLNEMRSIGVDLRVVKSGVTGTIVVLVDSSGERSFLTDRGAAEHLGSVENDALDGVDLLHVPAYSLTSGALAETAQNLIGEAVHREIPVSVSTSSLSVLQDYGRDRFLDLIKAIQPAFVLANAAEAKFLLQGHPWFRDAGATVVTAGARPARLTRPDGSQFSATPPPVTASDTTGAGDAFTGAFLVAHCDGADPEDALRAGHVLARRTLEQPGAQLAAD